MAKPLKPIVFYVLLALTDEPRHGWSLVREVQDRMGERLLPGNFYRTLRRMLSDGLIEEVAPEEPKTGHDERRRYFTLTESGERLAKAEARRLEALVGEARDRRLLKAR